MSSQLLPINQINALPVLTISGVVNGTVYRVGTRLARYFSPDDLGLNGVALSSFGVGGGAPNLCWYAATPYLNITGCSLISVVVKKTYGATLLQGQALTLFLQMRQGSLDVPSPFFTGTAGTPNDQLAGKLSMAAATAFQAAAIAGEVQRQLVTWGGMLQATYGQQIAFGSDNRLVLSSLIKSNTSVWNDAVITVSAWAA